MNVSEQIAALIPVNHAFLLPGGGNAPLVEAFRSKAVCCLHEHTAAVAAEAYAQIKGLGLALVTTGPGVTNAMTGLAAAWLDSTPLVLLSGQVKREYQATGGLRQRGFQELPNTLLTTGITKASISIGNPRDATDAALNSLTAATTGRQGPVHIDVPLDVQTAEVRGEDMSGLNSLLRQIRDQKPDKSPTADDAARRAAELLRKAERPCLLLGNGCRSDGIREVIDALGLPTLLTWRAADFLEEEHPLFCGRPGIAGQRGANIVQQSCDLLICVGARLDLGQTGYDVSLFAPRAVKFVVDIDPAESRKHCRDKLAFTGAVCDGRQFLESLADIGIHRLWVGPRCGITGSLVTGDGVAWRVEWRNHCRSTHERYRPRNTFYDALSDALRHDDVIVAGSSGTAAESTLQHIRIKRGQRLVFSPGLGSMGMGLPAAMGAHYATGRRVVCIEGDGSFAMNAYELETVRRLGLPIKLFVIRNGGYASIVRSQEKAGYGACVPSVPDARKLAYAHGIETTWANKSSEWLAKCMGDDGPTVITVDADCNLSHRMTTLPPGKPEEMIPPLPPEEHRNLVRWCS